MHRFSEEQREIVAELVTMALNKAVTSMEQMLRVRIKANHIKYNLGPLEHIPELDQLGRFKAHVVKLLFVGDIRGAFYFVILDHEVDLINAVCLPEQFKSEKRTESKLMKHGFMSEIENVIAALAVKEISDALGVQLELRVPKIQILSGVEINEFFEKENKIHKTAFHVKSVLEGQAVNISPLFIWVMDDRFLDVLRLNTSGL
jgi:chemotaxis protein CheY-P-specific phosphatase CheC